MGTVWLHLWWNLKKKWSSQIRENKPNRCGFRWGWGGRMGRGIRRHELQLQALGMWKLHGDYNLQKKPIRWHHRASGRSRYPETSPRVSSDPGVLQAGCLPAQTLWKFAAWAWVPTSPDISLRPASPHTPDAQHKLTEHFFVEHFSGTENPPVWARNETLPSRSLFI